MSEFYVRWNAVQQKAAEINGCASTLHSVECKLTNIRSNLYGLGRYRDVIVAANAILEDIRRESQSIKSLGKCLDEISTLYKNTEKKITGSSAVIEKVPEAETGYTEGTGEYDDDSIVSWSDLWTLLSEAGIVGKHVAGVGGMFTGDYLDSLSSFLDAFGDLAENAYATDQKKLLELLFGVGECAQVTESPISVVWKSIKESGDEFLFSSSKTVGQNIKVATKWAGVGITGILNGIENYEEFGTVNNARFWGETVLETATDVGLGIGAGALVAGGAALLGVAAPAVVVGVLGAGIVWGANALVEHFTGKDIGEWVADTVCDSIEQGVEAVKDFADDVGNAIVNGGKTIAGWFGFA